jgi:type VI secretion system secreted protein Hcp
VVVGQVTFDALSGKVQTASLFSIELEVKNTVTIGGGGGGGAGKASFGPLGLLKAPDLLSPALVLAVAQGKHLQKATVDLFEPGTTTPVLTYELKTVFVTGVSFAAGSEVPAEQVTLEYEEICTTFFGEKEEPRTCWNVAENKTP